MKKQGFTLIELLAVIVILAIIALIAVPIILNIVGSSKKSSVLRSGELYLKAVETAIARENLNNQFNPTTCIIGNDGNLTCDGDKTLTIEVNGSKPTSGTIALEKGKIKQVEDMTLTGFELEKKLEERLKIKGTSTIEPVEPENPKVSYLARGTSLSNDKVTFLKGPITKSSVESIVISNTKTIPSDIIGSWDASANQDGSIMAWYADVDSNGLYELYIGGEGGVKANPDSSYLFSRFTNVKEIDLKYLDTSDVTNMERMFVLCEKLITLNLDNIDTSNVTNMQSMFSSCISLIALDVSNFNTSKVTNMVAMFEFCRKLTTLDVSNFDTSNVTAMTWMFNMGESSGDSGALTEIIGLESFNTSKVTIMMSMFAGCNNLTTLDLSSFDTSNVTNMEQLFLGCSSLTTLNLSNFNTSKVTNMDMMFNGCSKLATLDLRNFDVSNVVTYLPYMFSGCNKLTAITVKDAAAQTFINTRLADSGKTGVTVTIA